uniref:Uncharacterized protein n=1 Tax=Nothobranchius pienaari TaxID=704102 RepID=A0A1A8LSE8_9TELE
MKRAETKTTPAAPDKPRQQKVFLMLAKNWITTAGPEETGKVFPGLMSLDPSCFVSTLQAAAGVMEVIVDVVVPPEPGLNTTAYRSIVADHVYHMDPPSDAASSKTTMSQSSDHLYLVLRT